MKWLLIFLVCGLFSGCYSLGKAKKGFGRAVTTFPEIGADYCARTYPVVAKTDSSGFKESQKKIDSLTGELQKDSLLSQQEKERLLSEIARIRAAIPEPTNCDSLYDALYKLVAQQMIRGDKLQAAYNNLLIACKSVKPIRDTLIDRAALDLCEIERRSAILAADREHKEMIGWKGKAKKRFWIIAGMGLIIALGIFGMLRKKITRLKP